MKFTKLQIGLIVTTLLTIGVNAAANIIPFNGISTGEVSDMFQTYFVPAGYTFLIWTLIYSLLLVFSFGLQAVPEKERDYVKEIAPWYLLASIANSIWMVAWHYSFFLTTVMLMLTLFVALASIYTILKANKPQSIMEKIVIHLPFQVYLGWVSVALIANISDVLWWLGWDGFGIAGPLWAAIMMLVAGALATFMVVKQSDIPFSFVVVWALVGIMMKFTSQVEMLIAGGVSILAIFSSIIFVRFLRGKTKKKTDTAQKKAKKK